MQNFIISYVFHIMRGKLVFARPPTPYGCAHSRDASRTLLHKFIYTDKNTSSIIPKPLKEKEIRQFAEFIFSKKTRQ